MRRKTGGFADRTSACSTSCGRLRTAVVAAVVTEKLTFLHRIALSQR
jgi:hypothetical protein